MFSDARSRRIVLVAHCVLNQNAVSDTTAGSPGSLRTVVDALCSAGVGVVQLPCPELHCIGLDRGDPRGGGRPVVEENTRIRAVMSDPPATGRIAGLVQDVVFQVEEYRRFGFEILGLVGINRSPSCGVETTCRDNREVPGMGVFVEALRGELEDRGICVTMLGIRGSEPDEASSAVEQLCRTDVSSVVGSSVRGPGRDCGDV